MPLTQDILLPILFAAVIANAVLLVLVVIARTHPRAERTPATITKMLAEQGSISAPGANGAHTRGWSRGDATSTGGAEMEATDAGSDRSIAEGLAPDDEPLDGWATIAQADPDDHEAVPSSGGSSPDEAAAVSGPAPMRDDLTGLIGPTGFMDLVVAEDARIRRYHRPGTIVVFELDGLDRLSARLGQAAVERVVPAVADTITRLARDADHVGRMGPGRFAALLPETDEVAAINYVERVRRSCELWLDSGAIALQLVVGWAGTAGDPTLPEAYRLATDRMYTELRRTARRTTIDDPGVLARS